MSLKQLIAIDFHFIGSELSKFAQDVPNLASLRLRGSTETSCSLASYSKPLKLDVSELVSDPIMDMRTGPASNPEGKVVDREAVWPPNVKHLSVGAQPVRLCAMILLIPYTDFSSLPSTLDVLAVLLLF